MNNKVYYILLVVLFSFNYDIKAQDPKVEIPLSDVLNTLEKRYEYRFNYVENTILGIDVIPPSESLSIKEAIDYLQVQTNLVFNFLEGNFISINRNNDLILCGYLKDKDTQSPLAFATIQGKQKSTISNENGYFELKVNSINEEITIRFLGYKSIYRQYKFFKTDSCNPIYLLAEQQALNQVILSNYLVEGINKLSTGDLEIDFKKFNILPGLIEADVLHSVQAFPGVHSINETVSNINIRGGTHDQNLILWDDIKMYQSGHFFGLISAFNQQITHKVSLFKNGTSTDYSDGVSGTIAMQTDQRVNQKFKGNISFNLIDANAFTDIPVGKKSSVQIAARKSLNDFVSTPTYKEYFSRISQDTELENNNILVLNTDQQFDFYDTSLRWIYRPGEKDVIRFNFININNELIFNENATVDNQEKSRESSVKQNSIAGGIFYQRKWNDNFQTTLQVYETDYKLKAINANLFESQRFLQENVVSETGARIKSSYHLNDRFILHTGYQFIETEVTNLDDVDVPLIRTLISDVVRTHSGFSQIDFRSNNKQTNLAVGFRYNYLDKFKKHIYEPRLSFYQKFLEYFGFEISGEFKHQTVSQVINFQNDFLGVEKRRWQMSNNEDIPVIESKQASIALNYSQKGWLFSTEGYYKNVDGITTQSQGFQNQYEFVKTDGKYEVIGVDMLVRKRFRNINLWLSYSIMDNEYMFEDLPEQRFPSNLDISQAVTFGTTYKHKGFKFSAGLNWHTGKPTTRPVLNNEIVEEEINYNATNSSRLEDYFRIDASMIYEFKIENVTANIGASVWNVIDNENEINNYYRINEDNMAQEFVQNALGLTPNVVVRFYF